MRGLSFAFGRFGRAGALPGAFGALLVLALGTYPAAAQDGGVTGTVLNGQTLEPLNGAQVFVPGTDIGTMTDRQGTYRLEGVPAGEVEVEARLIGYRAATRTVTVPAGQTVTADFELAVSAVQLEDVTVNVVTGLERRRLQVGTNVGEIDAAEVNKGAIQDFSDLLAGRAEGVILQDVSGTTGTSQRIRIRGAASLSLSNEPLIIVDGVYYNNSQSLTETGQVLLSDQAPSRLNDLNPEEIESIEIVKGPSAAALYGAVGANGVVIIRTRRGQAGGTDWHFYAEGGTLSDETDYPANFEAVQLQPGGDPNAPFFNELGFNGVSHGTPEEDVFGDWFTCPNFEAAAGNCTQDAFLSFNTLRDPRTSPFQTGDRQTYGMNVSGGSTQSTYFVSAEYEREDGVIEADFNSEQKWSARANLDAGLLDNLTSSLSTSYVSRTTDFFSNDNSIFSPILNGVGGMAGFVPGPSDAGVGLSGPPNDGPNRLNFLFFRNLEDLGEASLSTQEVDRFTGSANGRWQPMSWLTAQGTFGLDLTSGFNWITIQPGLDNLASDWLDGFRDATRFSRYNWTGNASASAAFDLTPEVTSTTTLGGSYQEELLNGVECFGAGLIEGADSCASTSARFAVDESSLNVVQLGAFAQQEFGWRDVLFVTGALRMDDNSNFGGEAPVELYPSANVSYLMSGEDWFPTDGAISELRLRGAFGVAGTRPAFRDAVTLFGPIAATIGGANVPGITLAETGNVDLEPERSTEYEAGFDLGLFGDRLGLGLTYFRKSSKDALIERELPASLGLTTSIWQNLGEVRNQGFEASLQALAVDTRDARADFVLQFTTLDNEIVELGEGVEPIVFGFNGWQRHDEGFPAGSFHQRTVDFEDANGDGLISADEVSASDQAAFIDESLPTWTVSLSANVDLFQFLRLNTLLDARGGHSQGNHTEFFRCRQFPQAGRGCEATGGQNASLEDQARFVAARFLGPPAGYVEDASFMKWRELSVTLTAPPSIQDAHPLLQRSSLTFSGRNLATWTGYGGLDPEVNASGSTENFRQEEFNTQPPVRLFTLRADVRF